MLERLEASGLTGMGGAGFPTWRKWDAVRREPGPRVVIVNADEGEPGTIKDRYVMELRPQLLLEGLAAAMRFCETDEAYIYLREEYAHLPGACCEDAIAARGLPVELVDRCRRVHLRRGDGDAGVDGGPARDAAAAAAVPGPVRLPRPADADQQRRDAGPRRADPPRRLAAGPALVGLRRGREARLLRGAARHHAPRPDRRVRRRPHRRAERDRPRRRRERDPPSRRPRRAADARGARRVGLRRRLGRACRSSRAATRRVRLLAETMRFFAEESCQKCTPCRIGNRALHAVFDGERDDEPRSRSTSGSRRWR